MTLDDFNDMSIGCYAEGVRDVFLPREAFDSLEKDIHDKYKMYYVEGIPDDTVRSPTRMMMINGLNVYPQLD